MTELQRHGDQGVFYSPNFLSEEFVAELFQASEVQPELTLPPPSALPEATEEAAFAHAWTELSDDPEFVAGVRQRGYTKEQRLAHFKRAMATPVTTQAVEKVVATLSMRYEQTLEDGAFVHRIDGERILVIPQEHPSGLQASKAAGVVLYSALVVIDGVILIAATADAYITVKKGRLAPKMKGILGLFRRAFRSPVVKELEQLEKAKKNLQLLVKIMKLVYSVGVSLKSVVGIILKDMGLGQWFLLGAGVLAAVLLFIASLGESIAFQVIALAALFTILCIDVVGLVRVLRS